MINKSRREVVSLSLLLATTGCLSETAASLGGRAGDYDAGNVLLRNETDTAHEFAVTATRVGSENTVASLTRTVTPGEVVVLSSVLTDPDTYVVSATVGDQSAEHSNVQLWTDEEGSITGHAVRVQLTTDSDLVVLPFADGELPPGWGDRSS